MNQEFKKSSLFPCRLAWIEDAGRKDAKTQKQDEGPQVEKCQ